MKLDPTKIRVARAVRSVDIQDGFRRFEPVPGWSWEILLKGGLCLCTHLNGCPNEYDTGNLAYAGAVSEATKRGIFRPWMNKDSS